MGTINKVDPNKIQRLVTNVMLEGEISKNKLKNT